MQRQRGLWDINGLKYKEIQTSNDFPKILQGGSIQDIFQTEEFSLNTKEIVGALLNDLDHLTYKFDEGTNLDFHLEDGTVKSVDCFLNGERIKIGVKEVILAAGEGNLEILKQMGVNPPNSNDPIQARRKSQMLVVQGNIPELTAIFPDLKTPHGGKGLFICNRPLKGNKRVWLVSDDISTNFETEDKFNPSVDKNRLQRTVRSLYTISPNLFKKKLEWSIYTGLTSERDIGKAEHMDDFFIESFGFKNIMTVWPTKLTLTPFVSKVIMKMIALKIQTPDGKIPVMDVQLPCQKPTVSDETWARPPFTSSTAVKTPLMNGKDFSDQYGPFNTDIGPISFK